MILISIQIINGYNSNPKNYRENVIYIKVSIYFLPTLYLKNQSENYPQLPQLYAQIFYNHQNSFLNIFYPPLPFFLDFSILFNYSLKFHTKKNFQI